jgi:hypothetical protein
MSLDEYEIEHYVDGEGQAVTECWLESEDDAVSQSSWPICELTRAGISDKGRKE